MGKDTILTLGSLLMLRRAPVPTDHLALSSRKVSVDIWERNKELIRKRTDIGEHFTREVIQSIVFIFYH